MEISLYIMARICIQICIICVLRNLESKYKGKYGLVFTCCFLCPPSLPPPTSLCDVTAVLFIFYFKRVFCKPMKVVNPQCDLFSADLEYVMSPATVISHDLLICMTQSMLVYNSQQVKISIVLCNV